MDCGHDRQRNIFLSMNLMAASIALRASKVLLFVGGVLLASGLAGGSTAFAASDDACAASAAALRELLLSKGPGRWELGSEIDTSRISYLDVPFIRQDFGKEDAGNGEPRWFLPQPNEANQVPAPIPSAELAQTFLTGHQLSATTCESVREIASTAGAAISAKTSRPHIRKNGVFDRTYIALTRAAVSSDGMEALIYVSAVSGSRAGQGYLLLLRRDLKGGWIGSSLLGVWIS